ncbi:hypothetical protein SAMN05443245_5620 [Paraburkholderia fungorum]|uniref:Uncharacterized protein n=1 Tax=Paraburkholderia fungorum TaxID=134537 RepID=A0A1H1ITY6_9BURK|nr:hypothetical protein [Paraburkholderia fungorum]SDR40816.1 hypothetical protein SAMN05443245_5620 [Paraburkholderia fungorum]
MSQSFAPALEPGVSAAAHDDLLYRKVSTRIIPFLFEKAALPVADAIARVVHQICS